MAEEMLVTRGVEVTYETVRRWPPNSAKLTHGASVR